MRQTIYLSRHGETDWNRVGRWQGHSDIVLNDHGRAQAKALAAALAEHGITGVRASDLLRARETGEIVASELGIGAVGLDAGLRERCFGIFEGLTRDECSERFPEEWASYCSELRLAPRGAEEASHVASRVHAAVLRSAASHRDAGALLLVSHGAAIRAFLQAVTGTLPPPLHNGATFKVVLQDQRFVDIESVR